MSINCENFENLDFKLSNDITGHIDGTKPLNLDHWFWNLGRATVARGFAASLGAEQLENDFNNIHQQIMAIIDHMKGQ